MGIEQYNVVYEIGNPDDVWGYSNQPDSYIWALASSMADYSVNTNVIYNSALKAFMLKPLPGSTDMTLTTAWESVIGSWKNITPPDLIGTFARQYHAIDWGIKSVNPALLSADGSFSVYIRRPKMKTPPADEYQTIEINDGTTSRKFKFYRTGLIEFLTDGTITETRNVTGEDLQAWKESNVIVLDFYTIGTMDGMQKILITSPLIGSAIVTDRVITANAYIQVNGKYAALVGVSLYTFPTSGVIVLNSMSQLTNGADDSATTPELKIYPPLTIGTTITDTYSWIGSVGEMRFKPTLTIASTGTSPVLIQAFQFGFAHAFTDPAVSADWYNITPYVVSMNESVNDELVDRQIDLELFFPDDAASTQFQTYYLASSSNPFLPAVAFRYGVYDSTNTLVLARAGLMRLGEESHADGAFSAINATVQSRLKVQMESDALVMPCINGENVTSYWTKALAVAGFNPVAVTVDDTGFFPDTGWDYDKIETGAGKSIAEFLKDIAKIRNMVIDDNDYQTILIRPSISATISTYILTTESAGYDDNEKVVSLSREFGNPDYCNSISIITDGEQKQEIYRAWSPEAITADKRIIHRTLERGDLSIAGETEASNELKKILELTETVVCELPPTGCVTLWPGTTQILINTDEVFAMGSPDNNNYIVSEVNLQVTTAGEASVINGTAVGKRKVNAVTINTESGFFPQGGKAAREAIQRNNGAWKTKEVAKKNKPKAIKTLKPSMKAKIIKSKAGN
ncbi:MAG: hypothetical protein WC748_09960 [Legionellales bacterium]|jgi:hypothetical protein